MEIVIFLLAAATVGLTAAALGGIFAIYSSRQGPIKCPSTTF